MRINKKKVKGFVVMSIAGHMEAYDAEAFENRAMGLIEKGEKNIIIDFEKLDYISSSGLRALINIKKRLSETGGRIVLTALKGKVLDVFRISKLLDVFEIAKDPREVVAG